MIADLPAWIFLPILGGVIRLVCVAPTVRATCRGEGAPSLVSWSVWTATTGLGTATSVAAGATVAAAVPAAAFLQCSSMFVATVIGRRRQRPDQRARATALDWTCLALCACTGTVWALASLVEAGGPETAALVATVVLCAAVATDGIASGPTWRLAWHGRESWLLWAGGASTPLLTLLVLRGDSVATWVYPGYELALTAGIAAMTVRRRSRATAVATLAVSAAVLGGVIGAKVRPDAALVLATAPALLIAAVLIARAWAVARGRVTASPIAWTACAVFAVAALIGQVRMGVLPLVVQTAVLAFVIVQMATVTAVRAWMRTRRAPAPDPPVPWSPLGPPDHPYAAYLRTTRTGVDVP